MRSRTPRSRRLDAPVALRVPAATIEVSSATRIGHIAVVSAILQWDHGCAVEVKGDTGKGAYPTDRRTLVSGNQASTIRVGYTFDSYNTGLDATYPASNTSLVGNQGNLQLLKHTGTTQSGGPLQTDG